MATVKTLIDVNKYKNSLEKIIFLNKNIYNNKVVLNNLYSTSLISDNHIELFKSFVKDIEGISKTILDVRKLISLSDEEGNIADLKLNENNVYDLFNINKETGDFELFGIEFNLKQLKSEELKLTKKDVKTKLLKHYNIPYEYFQYISTNLELMLGNNPLEEIIFAYDNQNIKKYLDEIIQINDKNIKGNFNRFTNEEQSYIRKLTFSRSMIDEIVIHNSHITKDSIEQKATKHKQEDLEEIKEILKNHKYISEIEIDKDTEIEKIKYLLKYINDLTLNIKKKFIFKIRKLGNYKAEGLYSKKLNMILIDVNNPSSLIHEITHLIDISNEEIYNSNKRQEIINHFEDKISLTSDQLKKITYYKNPKEIIARLSEIYFLNKSDKNNFKVKDYKIQLVKNKEEYLTEENNGLYFDFESFTEEDYKLLEEYFKNYYNIENKEIEEIDIDLESNVKKSKYDIIPMTKEEVLGYINANNIQYVFDYNKEHKIFKEGELEKYIFQHIDKVIKNFPTKEEKIKSQIKVLSIITKESIKYNLDFINLEENLIKKINQSIEEENTKNLINKLNFEDKFSEYKKAGVINIKNAIKGGLSKEEILTEIFKNTILFNNVYSNTDNLISYYKETKEYKEMLNKIIEVYNDKNNNTDKKEDKDKMLEKLKNIYDEEDLNLKKEENIEILRNEKYTDLVFNNIDFEEKSNSKKERIDILKENLKLPYMPIIETNKLEQKEWYDFDIKIKQYIVNKIKDKYGLVEDSIYLIENLLPDEVEKEYKDLKKLKREEIYKILLLKEDFIKINNTSVDIDDEIEIKEGEVILNDKFEPNVKIKLKEVKEYKRYIYEKILKDIGIVKKIKENNIKEIKSIFKTKQSLVENIKQRYNEEIFEGLEKNEFEPNNFLVVFILNELEEGNIEYNESLNHIISKYKVDFKKKEEYINYKKWYKTSTKKTTISNTI